MLLFFLTAIALLACGIQWGKTKIGSVWMKIQCHTFTDPTDNFLIVAPTYKILTQSTLPPFLEVMQGYGEFNKSDMTFKVHGGGTVYMRTGTDPDSIVGITNIRAIWGDEAGLFTLYFAENIAARAAFRNAQTLYTTSPYTLNWLYKQIILPKNRNPAARPDVTLIQAASWENPYFPKDVIERNRVTMDARRFNALFGGEWERMAGLVYDCFDDMENQCGAEDVAKGSRYVGGIDWGFTEPFVFKIRAISPDGTEHRGVHEFYASGLTISDIGNNLVRLTGIYPVEVIYCGPDQPGMILELNRILHAAGRRVTCVAANNDVRLGIDRHYELLKSRKLKYVRGANPYTMDEIDTYHYPAPDDLKPDENVKDAGPVKQNDHSLDSDRYITIMTYRVSELRKPFVPGDKREESQHARIARLKARRQGSSTEEWSA